MKSNMKETLIDEDFKKRISKIIKEGFDELKKEVTKPVIRQGHKYLCEDNGLVYEIDVTRETESSYFIYEKKRHTAHWILKSNMSHNVIEDITPPKETVQEQTQVKKKKFWFQ